MFCDYTELLLFLVLQFNFKELLVGKMYPFCHLSAYLLCRCIVCIGSIMCKNQQLLFTVWKELWVSVYRVYFVFFVWKLIMRRNLLLLEEINSAAWNQSFQVGRLYKELTRNQAAGEYFWFYFILFSYKSSQGSHSL